MNSKEKQMLDILKRGKEEFGYLGVKAEFEAEGTRTDELLRLIDIARKADVKIALKIGGCEAMKDLMEAKQIGIDYIVAPMVETPYALWKFTDAKNKVYTQEEQLDTKFLVNLETITAYNQLPALIEKATQPNGIDGFVFGRVDFVMSMGLNGREDINREDVTDKIVETARLCKASNLELVVGGGVSVDALPAIKRAQQEYLTRYETRKVLFAGDAVNNPNAERALLNAVRFELLWLENKRDYYGTIHMEDSKRIDMLSKRWDTLNG